MRRSPLKVPAWLWVVLIFVAALLPRALALGNYLTPDEPNWVYRTIRFGAALSRGEWATTAQAGHPGVTTMWLGSLGIAIERLIDPSRASEATGLLQKIDFLAPDNVEALKRIGALIDWARLPVIGVNALGVAGVFWLARRLFGQPVALLSAFLLALDPFAAGLGGLLHVDGLAATFSTVSLVALLNGISPIANRGSPQGSSFVYFALAGASAALAVLSKSPALFLIPFTAVVLAIAALTRRLSLRTALIGFLVFIILHSAVFILFYPAMWRDASAALDLMFERASHHAANATRPTFFDGQAELNHGFGFYPIALAYRLSPLAAIGLIVAAPFTIRQRQLPRTPARGEAPFALAVLILFSLAFIAFLSPAAKKFDRYLLPAIPPLIIAGAWGTHQLLSRLTPGSPANALLAAPVVLQALIVLSVSPYLLMAYNPLLGGAATARDRIAVGWGEGFGAAAQWIAGRDPGAAIVAGGVANVAPLYAGRSFPMTYAGWASSDYTVFTVSEVQLNPTLAESMAEQNRLAHVIRIGGIDAAWIYAIREPALQAERVRSLYRPGDAILLDAPMPLARLLDPLSVTALPEDVTPDQISAILGALRNRSRILVVSTVAVSPVVRRGVLTWLDANAARIDEARAAGATIGTYVPAPGAGRALDPFLMQSDGTIALIGVEPFTESAAYPDRVEFAVRWGTLARPSANYSATLQFADANGDIWGQFGGPLRNAADLATIDWQPGEVVDQHYSARLPPALAPGTYRLRFGLERVDGERLAWVSASGAFSGTAPLLSAIRIEPARELVDPDQIEMRERVENAWPGRAQLLGSTLLTYVPASGDQFLLTLYWRSLRDQLDPATELRWRVEPGFECTGACAFEWRTPLASNTVMALRAGDIVGASYSQRLPLELPDGTYRLEVGFGDEMFGLAKIDVVHKHRAFDLPGAASPAGSIGGFDLFLVESPPPQTRPGEAIRVRLALRAAQEVGVNYTVFVHLIDSAGRVAAQVDAWPQAGLWPTANWVRGQVVEDSYALALPPAAAPGGYRIAIGMYDTLDGSRLPVVDVRGRAAPDGSLILPAPIQVVEP